MKEKWNNLSLKQKLILVFVAFLLLSILSSTGKSTEVNKTQTKQPEQEVAQPSEVEPEVPVAKKEKNYELIQSSNNSSVENYFILFTGNEKSEIALKELATKVKSDICKSKCNVYLYDDIEALNIDYDFTANYEKYNKDVSTRKAWEKENLYKVKDTFLGYLSFDDDFFIHPYKDLSF